VKFGFIGATYESRSPNLDAEHSINLYPEQVESGTGVNQYGLYSTPGLRLFANLDDSPVRAMFSENGRLFIVAGGSFYEVNSDGSWVRYGTVAVDADPAQIVSNGISFGQVAAASGGSGYIFDTVANTLTQITDPEFVENASMVQYLDGFFIWLDRPNNLFKLSNLGDGLLYDGFDVAQRTFAGDPLNSMVVDHRELWLLGEQRSEIWFNSGAESFPLQPIIGTFIEDGTIAAWSVQQLDNSVFWLQGDERGHGIVMRAQGYTPSRVSNHSMEHGIRQLDDITDAIAYVYQQQGHAFYCLYFPTGLTIPRLSLANHVHWCYDVATGMWHERALWDPDNLEWVPHLSRHHAFAFGKNLVGDRQSGALYEMNLNFFDEEVIFPGP
jgi:hypothetical protein